MIYVYHNKTHDLYKAFKSLKAVHKHTGTPYGTLINNFSRKKAGSYSRGEWIITKTELMK